MKGRGEERRWFSIQRSCGGEGERDGVVVEQGAQSKVLPLQLVVLNSDYYFFSNLVSQQSIVGMLCDIFG